MDVFIAMDILDNNFLNLLLEGVCEIEGLLFFLFFRPVYDRCYQKSTVPEKEKITLVLVLIVIF